MKNDETFTLYGDGSQTRDFVYVADAVKALRLVATKTPKATVYNVAQGGETSLMDMIHIYEKVAGKKLKIKQMPARKGDINKSVADISKIKSIGFEPDWPLERGLKAYWEYENNK